MCRRAVGAALVTLALAGTATAQTVDPEAEHQRGIALRNEHRDGEALAVFRGLYERTGEVRALARMALAEAALSRWVDASEHLERALGSNDAWVAQNRASLAEAMATVQQHVGSLTVQANVPGAEVFIGGQRAAALPLERPLRVAAGTLEVEVRAPRHATAHRTVTVRGNLDVTALDVQLTPAPEPTVAPTVTPPVAVTPPTPPVTVELPAPTIDPQARRERDQRRATWETLSTTGFVLGGAGLLTSAIALGLRQSAVTTFNNNLCVLVSENPAVFTNDGRDCAAQYDRGETATAVAIAGLVTGVAFTTFGIVARVVSAQSSPERGHALACAPSFTHPGLLCGGRF